HQHHNRHSSLSDQSLQHERSYARIKIPPGCALRPPPPLPLPQSPSPAKSGQTRGNGSWEMNGASGTSFQRSVVEPSGGRPSFKNSVRTPLAVGRNSRTSTGSGVVSSLDSSAVAAGVKRGSNDGEGG
ncbi:unnamed protein product, partial [Scytosiphon promiscuus]